ncbi:Hypothetical predicted protein, partial [Olea europaea subsp. europaea]
GRVDGPNDSDLVVWDEGFQMVVKKIIGGGGAEGRRRCWWPNFCCGSRLEM